jgi:predicted kinase
LIGQWPDAAAGQLVRSIALAAARVHLTSSHDVIVPQFLGRPEFIEALEHLAHDVDADFHEIVLMLSKTAAVRRFAERTRAAASPAHLEAQQLLDVNGGTAELEALHDRLTALLASRPHAHVIAVATSTPEETYREIRRVLT